MPNHLRCVTALVAVVFLLAGCAPGSPTPSASPAVGAAISATNPSMGDHYAASFIGCGVLGNTLSVSFSGLDETTDYGLAYSATQLGGGWSDSAAFPSTGSDTFVFAASQPLPFVGCFTVTMNTHRISGSDTPSPFNFYVAW